MKKLFTLMALIATTAATMTMAQTSIPTNGLVGYYPFNGNANDYSSNGNNGVNNGAILTNDRFDNANKAYYFDGSNAKIVIPNATTLNVDSGGAITISCWLKHDLSADNINKYFISKYSGETLNSSAYALGTGLDGNAYSWHQLAANSTNGRELRGQKTINDGEWHNVVSVLEIGVASTLYVDGKQDNSVPFPLNGKISNALDLYFGCNANSAYFYQGSLDDIRIYNRTLSQQEIKSLYLENIVVTTVYDTIKVVTTDTVHHNIYDTLTTHIVINDSIHHTFYDTLTTHFVVNDTIHHNLFDTLTTHIVISDTVYTNLYDTIRVSVTDTLIIHLNTTVGINPLYITTVKVYPNPTADYVTIDNGEYSKLNNYSIQIMNIQGQSVYQTTIIQQQNIVNLSSLGGAGTYYLKVFNSSGKEVENRKILLIK